MNHRDISSALRNVKLAGLVGRPGCGKEFTGDELLKMKAGYARIIMSQLINAEKERGTAIGMLMRQYQDAGQLVPDEHVVDLFLNHVAGLHQEGFTRIITDGFPRNDHQQDIILERTGKFTMFFIELPVEKAVERMLGRGRSGETREICMKRQKVFEEATKPMISRFADLHPESFVEINGLWESPIRAKKVHEHMLFETIRPSAP